MATATPPAPALERVIGVRALTASAFNMTVGSGIFALPAQIAVLIGAAAPIPYFVCAFAMAMVVLCFAEAGSRVHRTGGAYAYAEAAFGPFVGALTGALLYVGSGALASASVINIFATTLAVIAPALGHPVARALIMAATYGGLAFLNIRGARPGVRTMEVFTLGKLIPLVVLAVAGLFFMHPANFAMPAMPTTSELGRACVVLVFAFLGFESALNPSGEVKDPNRTVPRGVLYALVLVTALYLSIQMVAQGVLGGRLAQETAAPLAATAGVVMGPLGARLMLVGALLSTFGYLTGDALTTPRTLFALAENQVLPPVIARVHPRFRTPWIACITHAALSFVLAVSGTYLSLIVAASVAILLVYIVIALGVLRLRRLGVRTGGDPFVVPGGPVVPVLAVIVVGYIALQAQRAEWLGTLITLVLATLLYGFSLIMRGRGASAGAPVEG